MSLDSRRVVEVWVVKGGTPTPDRGQSRACGVGDYLRLRKAVGDSRSS